MTAEEIKGIREWRKITQLELARLVGVHPQTVSKWERALLEPTTWQRSLLARLAVHRGPRGASLRDLLERYDSVTVLTTKLWPR